MYSTLRTSLNSLLSPFHQARCSGRRSVCCLSIQCADIMNLISSMPVLGMSTMYEACLTRLRLLNVAPVC